VKNAKAPLKQLMVVRLELAVGIGGDWYKVFTLHLRDAVSLDDASKVCHGFMDRLPAAFNLMGYQAMARSGVGVLIMHPSATEEQVDEVNRIIQDAVPVVVS